MSSAQHRSAVYTSFLLWLSVARHIRTSLYTTLCVDGPAQLGGGRGQRDRRARQQSRKQNEAQLPACLRETFRCLIVDFIFATKPGLLMQALVMRWKILVITFSLLNSEQTGHWLPAISSRTIWKATPPLLCLHPGPPLTKRTVSLFSIACLTLTYLLTMQMEVPIPVATFISWSLVRNTLRANPQSRAYRFSVVLACVLGDVCDSVCCTMKLIPKRFAQKSRQNYALLAQATWDPPKARGNSHNLQLCVYAWKSLRDRWANILLGIAKRLRVTLCNK